MNDTYISANIAGLIKAAAATNPAATGIEFGNHNMPNINYNAVLARTKEQNKDNPGFVAGDPSSGMQTRNMGGMQVTVPNNLASKLDQYLGQFKARQGNPLQMGGWENQGRQPGAYLPQQKSGPEQGGEAQPASPGLWERLKKIFTGGASAPLLMKDSKPSGFVGNLSKAMYGTENPGLADLNPATRLLRMSGLYNPQ